MKILFNKGDQKIFTRNVATSDLATFDSGEVHPVYSTFALARDAEWACRLFALDTKEEDEEGIGTMISVNHHSPALIGSEIRFTATIESISGNEIICTFEAHVADRLIASGKQGQKILKKERIERLFKESA